MRLFRHEFSSPEAQLHLYFAEQGAPSTALKFVNGNVNERAPGATSSAACARLSSLTSDHTWVLLPASRGEPDGSQPRLVKLTFCRVPPFGEPGQ